MSTFDGKLQSLGSLMKGLSLAAHCPSCANELATWSSISKSELKRTTPSSIQISIGCCALDSLTLVDVRSLLVRPRYKISECGICSPVFLDHRGYESSPTTESLTSRGSNTLRVKPFWGSIPCLPATHWMNDKEHT